MEIKFAAVNWLAVLVAGVATFMLGGMWYTALFGERWKKLQGFTDEQIKEMQKYRPPAAFFGGMVASYLVLALAVALLTTTFNVQGLMAGVEFGFLLWLGPAASLAMTAWIASGKPIGLYYIDAGFYLVALIVTTTILAVWH